MNYTLVFRNIRRSLRDYSIYFLTLTVLAALMNSFLSLSFSEDILTMSENMTMLQTGLLGMSILVSVISSFVVHYAICFMLTLRKKEFAIYELLGMELKTICRLFLGENAVIGSVSYLLGISAGTVLTGVLVKIVNNIFHLPHSYQIFFSGKACLLSLALFGLMYGIGLLRAAQTLRRRKIAQLLQEEHQNEPLKQRNIMFHVGMVLLSMPLMVIGGFLIVCGLQINTNLALLYFAMAVLCLLVGLYTIHRQIPILLIFWAKKSSHYRFKNENLFFLGQIGRRLQSSGRTLAVISILLSLSLLTMFLGLTMGAGYKGNIEREYPYDIGFSVNAPITKESMKPVQNFVEQTVSVSDVHTYHLYTFDEKIDGLALSDYNILRKILGYPEIALANEQYLVHSDTWTHHAPIQDAISAHPELLINDRVLTPAKPFLRTEPMENYTLTGTGGYVLVLPDQIAGTLSADKCRMVLSLHDDKHPELRSEIRRFVNSGAWTPILLPGTSMPEHTAISVAVKAWGIQNSLTGFTTLSFCGLYLSLIFVILSCAVLAFQQLFAIDINRRNYQLLHHMGVEQKQQTRLLNREISTVFLIPMGIPLLLLLLAVLGTQQIFGATLAQPGLVWQYGFVTVLVFAMIYGTYYLAVKFLFHRTILNHCAKIKQGVTNNE